MFTPLMRLFLAMIGFGAGVLLAMNGRWILGTVYFASGLLFVWGQWRYVTLWSAKQAFARGDLSLVRTRLAKLDRPARLTGAHRAYYDWMSGMVALEDGDGERARELLTLAAEGPLRTENDRGIVRYQLAQIALAEGDEATARTQLEQARALRTGPEVRDIIAAMEKQLAPEAG